MSAPATPPPLNLHYALFVEIHPYKQAESQRMRAFLVNCDVAEIVSYQLTEGGEIRGKKQLVVKTVLTSEKNFLHYLFI